MFNKRQPSSSAFDDRPSASSSLDYSMTQPAAVAAVARLEAVQMNSAEGAVIIGKGTRIVGEITDCSRVEIQGAVDGTIIADVLIIREGGSLTGRLQASHAEVHGAFNGQLEIADLLDIRATGTVEGDLAYGKLAVAMGGHISGNVTNPRPEPPVSASNYAEPAPAEPAAPTPLFSYSGSGVAE